MRLKNPAIWILPALMFLLVHFLSSKPSLPNKPAHPPLDNKPTSWITFLHTMENPQGGFHPDATKPLPSLRSTVGALRVFRMENTPCPNHKAHINFLQSCWKEKDGGFADHPESESADVISTAVGLMGLSEWNSLAPQKREAGRRFLGEQSKSLEDIRIACAFLESETEELPWKKLWTAMILGRQNQDGTFGSGPSHMRDTASMAVTMIRLKEPLKVSMDPAKHRQPDHGFGSATSSISDMETTYRICRWLHLIQDRQNLALTLPFLESCKNQDGGYGPRPKAPSTTSSTYQARIIQYWASIH